MAFGRAYSLDSLSSTVGTEGFAPTVTTGNTVEALPGARTGNGQRITRTNASGLVYQGVGGSSLPPSLVNAQMWYGFALRCPTGVSGAVPSVDTVVVRIGTGAGISAYLWVDQLLDCRLQIQNGTKGAVFARMTQGTWHWFELLHDVSGLTWTFEGRMDLGTASAELPSLQAAASTSRLNALGTDVSSGGTYVMDYDDIVVHTAQTAFLPNRRKVVVLRPDADISGTFTITGGDATRSAAIDEVTPDDATSYITANVTTSPGQVVHVSNYTLASGESFEGASTYGRVGSTGTTTRTVTAALRNSAGTLGTGSAWSAAINGWQNSSVARDDAALPGGQAWNQANVDGLGLSLVGSATTVRITQAYVALSIIQPAGGQTFLQTVTAAATGTPTRSAQARRGITGAATGLGAVARAPSRLVVQTATGTATLVRRANASRAVSATGTPTALIARIFTQTIAAVATATAAAIRSAALSRATGATGTGTLVRHANASRAASSTATPTVATSRAFTLVATAAALVTPTALRSVRAAYAAAAGAVAIVSRLPGVRFSASAAGAPDVSNMVATSRSASAIGTPVASVARQVAQVVAAVATATASIARRVLPVRTVQAVGAPSLLKFLATRFEVAVTATPVVLVNRGFSIILSAAASASASVRREARLIHSAQASGLPALISEVIRTSLAIVVGLVRERVRTRSTATTMGKVRGSASVQTSVDGRAEDQVRQQ